MRKVMFCVALMLSVTASAQVADTRFVSVTPTVDTSAYASGDVIGGKLTFSNALPWRTGTGFLVSVTISDKAAQASDLDLVLFESDPDSSTFTDQAAFDPADADLSKVLTVVNFGSSSRFAFNDNGVKHVASLAVPIKGRSSAGVVTLYGVLVSRGTPTFASSSDVTVKLGIAGD